MWSTNYQFLSTKNFGNNKAKIYFLFLFDFHTTLTIHLNQIDVLHKVVLYNMTKVNNFVSL